MRLIRIMKLDAPMESFKRYIHNVKKNVDS